MGDVAGGLADRLIVGINRIGLSQLLDKLMALVNELIALCD